MLKVHKAVNYKKEKRKRIVKRKKMGHKAFKKRTCIKKIAATNLSSLFKNI